jgi:pimeloyl-ACP methyl ester carboxylesterase
MVNSGPDNEVGPGRELNDNDQVVGSSRVSRRGVLRAASAVAAGGVGLSMVSGSASAGWKECPYSYSGSTPWYNLPNQSHGSFPWGTDELTLYIHGWRGSDNATDQGSEVRAGLQNNGYSGNLGSIIWDSDSANFSTAEDNADRDGQELAAMLRRNGLTFEQGTNVRLIGFSLGTRVALQCARTLASWDDQVTSLHLLGSAVPEDWIQARYWSAIESGTTRTHNFHSPNDPVLYLHPADSLGHHGTQGSSPGNYTDHDVSWVDEHCAYMHRQSSIGCLNNIVNNDPGM